MKKGMSDGKRAFLYGILLGVFLKVYGTHTGGECYLRGYPQSAFG